MSGGRATAERRMTLAEFLEWDGGGGDDRYELVSGVPVAMTPPRRAHGTLVAALAGELRGRLPSGCVVVVEAGILSPSDPDTWYQADLAVTCEPALVDQQETPSPRLLVEVLSPSTEAHDRRVKLVDYRRIPSVEEILLVDPERPYGELHRRLADGRWVVELLTDLAATISLASLGAELALGALYADLEPRR